MPKIMIDDEDTFTAEDRWDNPIPTYDDGFGDLYIYRDSSGIQGIVRAQSWENAYGICEDEFKQKCDCSLEELQKEYPGFDTDAGNDCYDESHSWCNSGAVHNDLNCEALDLLTGVLAKALEITITIKSDVTKGDYLGNYLTTLHETFREAFYYAPLIFTRKGR